MINEGDKPPALEATSSDGSTRRPVVSRPATRALFLPKDDTSGCTREAQDFTELRRHKKPA